MRDFFEMVVIPIGVSVLVVCVIIGCAFGFFAVGEHSACESYTQIDAQHNYQ